MDTIDRAESNLPAPFPIIPSSFPALVPAFSGDLATTTSTPLINSRTLLRGLTRHWGKILLIWLVVSAPVVYLIYRFVEPTFEAFSYIRIEPGQFNIFAPARTDMIESRGVLSYLQTQLNLITCDRVLGEAIASPEVINLAVIKDFYDPKNQLRKVMSVEIVKDAFLIRVALELSDGNQAASIVNAVVHSYLLYNREFKRSENSTLKANLVFQKVKLHNEINIQQAALRALFQKGTVDPGDTQLRLNASRNDDDATKPTVSRVTIEQSQVIVAAMMRTDLELIEAEALLKVTTEAADQANQASEEEKGQQSRQDDNELEHRIQEEFGKDPEVIALSDEIAAAAEQRDHVKSLARQPNDPARLRAEAKYKKLSDQYTKHWNDRYDKIRKQLKSMAAGTSRSLEVINNLKIKVQALKAKRADQARLFEELKIDKKVVNNDAFEATIVKYQLDVLLKREDQVQAHLQQLEFEATQETYRVDQVDPAAAPKSATNNKRVKYMAGAPVALLFMVLGLFLLLEVKGERIADPDTLSARVRSEVFALPPLLTPRSIRKLSESEAENQIEQFMQRLDHLRFAVCGNPSQLGKGRCVLITSAIGSEGKTTLAAHLAARCGTARMSTLLIDADLRRAKLCLMLDVPEGLGLSDVLNDEATIDEAVIPIQEGKFHLLRAGTPIQDTSRVLQSRNLGLLINQLRQDYDLIIIDSPPVLPVPDALILGRWADGAILAARYDISRFPQVERARRQLDNAGIAILGTVINGMRHTDSYYGRYNYSRQRSTQSSSSDTI